MQRKKSKYSTQPYYNITNGRPIQSNLVFLYKKKSRSIQNDPIITKLVWLHVDPHQKPNSNLEPPYNRKFEELIYSCAALWVKE